MQTITKPDQIKDWQFQMFMVNTFAFQLEKWAVLPDNAPLIKENRDAIKHLRNKCRKLIELGNVRPLSEIEEEFYKVGDEFHAILGYIQNQKDPHLGFNLFEVCVAIATDDYVYLKHFLLSLHSILDNYEDLPTSARTA